MLTSQKIIVLSFFLFICISCSSTKELRKGEEHKWKVELISKWEDVTLNTLDSINGCSNNDTILYVNYENECYTFISPKEYVIYVINNRIKVLDIVFKMIKFPREILIEEIYRGPIYKYNIYTSEGLISLTYQRDLLTECKINKYKYTEFASYDRSIVRDLFDNKMNPPCQYPDELIIISEIHFSENGNKINLLCLLEE